MATAHAARARSPTGSMAGGRSSSTADNHTGPKDDLKINKYHGDRKALNYFLTQLKVVFKLRSTQYPNAQAKVLYAAMQLKGPAFDWFEPTLVDYLESETKEPETIATFRSFANFETSIRKIYGNHDEEKAAARKIHSLKQTGSAALYFSEFNQLASKLDWDENALGSAYYTGLKDVVKDRMIDGAPDTYKELVDESIKIDNRLYERRLERGSGGWAGRQNYGGKSSRNYGDPMDLSMMHRGTSRPGNQSKKRNAYGSGNRGNLDNKEREKRKKDNLCYNCGKSGHRARECKTQAQELHMMTVGELTEITGIEETKADTSMRTSDEEEIAQRMPWVQRFRHLMTTNTTTISKENRREYVRGTLSEYEQAWLMGWRPFRSETENQEMFKEKFDILMPLQTRGIRDDYLTEADRQWLAFKDTVNPAERLTAEETLEKEQDE
jgi:hypothetical protein